MATGAMQFRVKNTFLNVREDVDDEREGIVLASGGTDAAGGEGGDGEGGGKAGRRGIGDSPIFSPNHRPLFYPPSPPSPLSTRRDSRLRTAPPRAFVSEEVHRQEALHLLKALCFGPTNPNKKQDHQDHIEGEVHLRATSESEKAPGDTAASSEGGEQQGSISPEGEGPTCDASEDTGGVSNKKDPGHHHHLHHHLAECAEGEVASYLDPSVRSFVSTQRASVHPTSSGSTTHSITAPTHLGDSSPANFLPTSTLGSVTELYRSHHPHDRDDGDHGEEHFDDERELFGDFAGYPLPSKAYTSLYSRTPLFAPPEELPPGLRHLHQLSHHQHQHHQQQQKMPHQSIRCSSAASRREYLGDRHDPSFLHERPDAPSIPSTAMLSSYCCPPYVFPGPTRHTGRLIPGSQSLYGGMAQGGMGRMGAGGHVQCRGMGMGQEGLPGYPAPVSAGRFPVLPLVPLKRGDPSWWTFGTSFHAKGTCTPCRYEWTKGCLYGSACRFCHHEDHTPHMGPRAGEGGAGGAGGAGRPGGAAGGGGRYLGVRHFDSLQSPDSHFRYTPPPQSLSFLSPGALSPSGGHATSTSTITLQQLIPETSWAVAPASPSVLHPIPTGGPLES